MKENLEKVIRKIILPAFGSLGDFKINIVERGEGTLYEIIYLLKYRIDYQDAFDIETETHSLFDMLSPDGNEDRIVRFEPGKNFKYN